MNLRLELSRIASGLPLTCLRILYRIQTRQISFSNGTKLVFPEAMVDVDSSCLKLINIFDPDDLELLQKAFPIKKGCKELTEWTVTTASETIFTPLVPSSQKRQREETPVAKSVQTPSSELAQTPLVPVVLGLCECCSETTLIQGYPVMQGAVCSHIGYYCRECYFFVISVPQ
jgi:hypothetical protein